MDLYQTVVYFSWDFCFFFQYVVINYNKSVFYITIIGFYFHEMLLFIPRVLNPFHRRIEKVVV